MSRILLIVAVTMLFSAWTEAQSIADIARTERARQENIQRKITITNDSVIRSSPVAAGKTVSSKVQPPPADRPAAIAEKAPALTPVVVEEPSVPEVHAAVLLPRLEYAEVLTPPVAPVRDEKWWRNAFQDARNNLKKAEDQLITLQVALNQARLDSLLKTDGYRETRLAAERRKRELDSAQKEVVNARKNISQLEEELRRSGGLPAWAR